jgi:hypothetical protein
MSNSYFLEFKLKNHSKHLENIEKILKSSPLRAGGFRDSSTHLTQCSFHEPKLKVLDSINLKELLEAKEPNINKIKLKIPRNLVSDNKAVGIKHEIQLRKKIESTYQPRSSLSPSRWLKIEKNKDRRKKYSNPLKKY